MILLFFQAFEIKPLISKMKKARKPSRPATETGPTFNHERVSNEKNSRPDSDPGSESEDEISSKSNSRTGHSKSAPRKTRSTVTEEILDLSLPKPIPVISTLNSAVNTALKETIKSKPSPSKKTAKDLFDKLFIAASEKAKLSSPEIIKLLDTRNESKCENSVPAAATPVKPKARVYANGYQKPGPKCKKKPVVVPDVDDSMSDTEYQKYPPQKPK